MNSNLYYDVPEDLRYSSFLQLLEEYGKKKQIEIFVLKVPKSDLNSSSYEHDGCFMVLSPGYKIALVNAYASSDEFTDYIEDIKTVINYLYSKYQYRDELGRFSKWGESLLDTFDSLSLVVSMDIFWDGLKAETPAETKNTELLVTLCTGSVNDIKRVKANVPIELLDQVKQKIQSFDADQTRFIYQELNQKLVKIQGLSGTGKTELLLHKLKELYQKNDNTKIYVTCHNKILADSLLNRIPDFFNFMKVTQQIKWNERLWCSNAWGGGNNPNSGLYRFICGQYGIPFSPYSNFTSFESVCDEAISSIKAQFPDGDIPTILDYIIVDECQDFKDNFFELCKLVTSKQVYVAGDIFQSIFSEHISKDYNADFYLSKCYRTDPRTLMFAHALGLGLFEESKLRWLSKDDWEACGYTFYSNNDSNSICLEREPVRRFVDISDSYESISLSSFCEDDFDVLICEQLHKLISANPTSTVDDFCVIFLDSDQSVYSMANILEAKVYSEFGWHVNKAYESKKKIQDTLLISNRNNVKGLEYPFVLCITKQIMNGYRYRNALYTMLTRSFLKTILFLPKIDDAILAGYEEIMKNRRMTLSIPTESELAQIETRFKEAKRRRPVIEIIGETVSQMNLNKEDNDRLYNAAISLCWDDLPEDEIRSRVNDLYNLL